MVQFILEQKHTCYLENMEEGRIVSECDSSQLASFTGDTGESWMESYLYGVLSVSNLNTTDRPHQNWVWTFKFDTENTSYTFERVYMHIECILCQLEIKAHWK